MLYGHLSVVFFLVLSGFSLALSPAAAGWRTGNVLRFARRRAWRILPAYWAALAFSLLVGYFVVPASHHGAPTEKTVAVYGLLLQDLFQARTPNGAFWSIAVEVELYLVFPLLIVARRRLGAAGLLALAVLPIVAKLVLAGTVDPRLGVNRLALGLAPVFVAGIVAAGVVLAPGRTRRVPWHWLFLATSLPVLAVMLAHGSTWSVHHYFWIDLALTPAMAFLVIAVAGGRPAALQRVLEARPLRKLGSFSYSLYLIHLPIIMVISHKLALPRYGHGLHALVLTMALGLPLSLLGAWIFATVFEIPFQRYRSWDQLRRSFIPAEPRAERAPLPAPAVQPAVQPAGQSAVQPAVQAAGQSAT
jgi:peptidoglycan/LPS O-acetylase OafA/YrhL